MMIRSLVLTLLFAASPALAQEPAFKGAEGFGSTTPGGRGGRVIYVTTLAEDGPGSLAAAVHAKGPRIVNFKVAGTINFTKKPLVFDEPFLTIAGQTAPEGGICISGEEVRVHTHDVVIRHLRIRTGDADVPRDGWDNRDGINFGDPTRPGAVYNVILDHCSISWSVDECLTCWYDTHDVTIQWCIIGQGLRDSFHPKGEHSMGLLVGDDATRISLHHNLLASCNQRMPQFAGRRSGRDSMVAFYCNTVFNWGEEPAAIEHENNVVYFANNYFQSGPDFAAPKRGFMRMAPDADDAMVYVEGNIDEVNPSGNGDGWSSIWGFTGGSPPQAKHRIVARPPEPAITLQDAKSARWLVLIGAGARLPRRDAIDTLILNQVNGPDVGGSLFVDSPSDVGGWPNLAR